MLLYHLRQQYIDQLRPYLIHVETECIDRVLLKLFTLVEAP
jgi:hypothetical protein